MIQNFYTKDIIGEKYKNNIGEYTYGNPKIFDWNDGTQLRIGKFCSIAENVTFILGGEHRTDWVTTYSFSALTTEWSEAKNITGHPKTKGDITIGNDVWLGFGVTILSGVTIGSGAVIGANATVTKDIEPYTINGGNPTKFIRYRFNQETIKNLLHLKWWDWPLEKINKNLKLLCNLPSKNNEYY